MVKASNFKLVSVVIKHLQEVEYSESCGLATNDVS